jgi:hypothetical protein
VPNQSALDHWVDVDDDEDIRQGDVLRRMPSNAAGQPAWAFVITADCDIAQEKAGDCFSYVDIVPAEHYLDRYWAPTQLRKFITKQAMPASEQLNAIMRKSGLDLTLQPEALMEWLRTSSVADLSAALNRTGKPFDAKLISRLEALSVAASSNPALTRYRQVRSLMGDGPESVKKLLQEAFDGERGFPDYFLIPEMPLSEQLGFVVMLRAISSVDAAKVFSSEADARISGQRDAFHRIGRTSDRIRFAVVQKLSFLFSRIGLPTHFEDACSSAAELLAESVVAKGPL